MEYIPLKMEHVQQVAKLEAECFSMPWSERSIASEITNPLSYWIIAVDGDTVVGYVGSQSVMGEADMMNIAVDHSYRRRGIAKELVEKLIQGLCEREVHCLTLEVRCSNAAAISLYERLGFEQVGRRPNYYSAPKEDALILRKEWAI